jgi:hypothetical protein
MNKEKIKITGIKMSVQQWLQLFKEPYKSDALNEFKGSRRYQLSSLTTSLLDAINKFNWEDSIKGRSYWEKIHADLYDPTVRDKYLDNSITQFIN